MIEYDSSLMRKQLAGDISGESEWNGEVRLVCHEDAKTENFKKYKIPVDKDPETWYSIKVAAEQATTKKPASQVHIERCEASSQSNSDNQIEMQPWRFQIFLNEDQKIQNIPNGNVPPSWAPETVKEMAANKPSKFYICK